MARTETYVAKFTNKYGEYSTKVIRAKSFGEAVDTAEAMEDPAQGVMLTSIE